MKEKYQIEYEQSSDCFWAKEPAKYVRLFVEKYMQNLRGFHILDLGAGEGKNAVFLANKGANVLGIDISPIALSRFSKQPNYISAKDNVKIECKDIRKCSFEKESFDLVVAYGIFHCLTSRREIAEYISIAKSWIKKDGYFIIVTFTDEIAPPMLQSYLERESFLRKGELESLFEDWMILEKENGIITETHPTSKVVHEHSLVRLIAKKI
uniref:class I SAM-dependent methyltransferase n=1 Tax=uncultured Dysgonomonas sp. TaxID=206096 RepID=UPI002626665E|nr:class I SAM-dependent methyltransferase [uncultured Dysgonomonas sp.]